MNILVSNLSLQPLINFGVTYIPTSGGGPTTDNMNLGARDIIRNIGTVGVVPNSAISCVSVTFQTSSGPVTLLLGQSQPVPAPIGFNFLVGWAVGTENVVITVTDFEGGMTQ